MAATAMAADATTVIQPGASRSWTATRTMPDTKTGAEAPVFWLNLETGD